MYAPLAMRLPRAERLKFDDEPYNTSTDHTLTENPVEQ